MRRRTPGFGGTLLAVAAIAAATVSVCPLLAQPGPGVGIRNGAGVAPAAAPAVAGPDAAAPAEPPPAMPLVNTDEELDEYLHQAEEHIAKKEYDKAIEVLQALVISGQRVFHRTAASPRRYVSLRAAAAEVLGRMPPDGLDLYRRLYDPQAARLWAEAERTGDAALLRRIVEEYAHTQYGDRALDRLGAVQFDQGAFLQAAHAWESAAGGAPADAARQAMRLAKAAIAYHLAGESRKAADLAAALKRDHPSAEGTIAGRTENLAALVARSLESPPPVFAAAEPMAADTWPSFAGSPSGMAVGAACDAAVFPLWQQPQDADRRAAMIRTLLGMPANLSASDNESVNRNFAMKTELRDGQVTVSSLMPGRRRGRFTLAPMLHPIVLGDLVLVREHDEVTAYDVATGRRIWRTAGLPMYRDPGVPIPGYPTYQTAPLMGDAGRYTLTAGGGKVFTVCGFLPSGIREMMMWQQQQRGAKPLVDGSTLAAVSLAAQGKILWQVGSGAGDGEIAREGKFLTAPTYADGRLYAVALHIHAYHAVCLDAETGATVWETCVGQEPGLAGSGSPWQSPMYSNLVLERGSPPAVADGRVFVTTNAGLVAALAADTGEPLWTYQYPSMLTDQGNETLMRRFSRAMQGDGQGGPLPPVNPILVTRGRVLCLPSDSPTVFALAADSGDRLWQADRQDQQDLTALDDERVLLSGRDLVVLGTRDGSSLKVLKDVGPIVGRPAVAGGAVMASGKGEIVRLDLATWAVTRHPVLQEDGLLGRLVSAGGRLAAANAAGLSVYFNYDDAWNRLGQRLQETDAPSAKFDLRLARGQFALAAGRLERAEEEFRAAGDLAAAVKDPKALAAARPWLYRLALRRANAEPDDARLGRLLDEAGRHCPGPAAEGEMLLRRMRWHERFGRHAQAAECAQAVAATYADVRLRDVALGPDADPMDRPTPGDPPQLGQTLGQRHVARLIEQHGKDVYARFDEEARQALERGQADGAVDAMLAAQRQYPHSRWADALLMAAAERLYAQARPGGAADPDLLDRADRVLAEMRNYPSSPLALRARAATALVDRERDPDLARLLHGGLARQAAATPIDFGDYHGTPADLAAMIAAPSPAKARPRPPAAHLAAPLEEVYRVKDDRLMVLRDGDRQPIRLGPRLVLAGRNRIVCLDTRTNDYAAGLEWTARFGAEDVRQVGYLTADLKHLAVVSSDGLTLLETSGGRLVYQKRLSEMGLEGWMGVTGAGGCLVLAQYHGRLFCIGLERGEVLWKTDPLKNPNAVFVEAAGDIVTCQDHGMREGRVFDARTGQLLMELSGRNRVEITPTADGLALAVQDNTAGLYDPRRPKQGPLWMATMPERQLGLLGAGGRYAAVGGMETRNVYAIDLESGGQRVVRVGPTTLGSRRYVAGQAVFEGDRMYLLCGTNAGNQGPGMTRRLIYATAPAIQAVDLAAGKPLWTTTLTTNERVHTNIDMAIVPGPYLSVLVKPSDFREPTAWFVLAKDTGKVICSGGPTADEAAEAISDFFHARRQLMGQPAITNGRLFVEDEAGVVLLRSPL